MRVIWTGMAIDDPSVSVFESFDHGDPGECYPWDIPLFEFPDDLFVGVDFDDSVAVTGPYESISVCESHHGIEFGSDVVFPDDFACTVVFACQSECFVGDDVVSVGGGTNESGIAVWIRVRYRKGNRVNDFFISIDFDDPSRSALGDHGQAVG